jgi:hypothetical protein
MISPRARDSAWGLFVFHLQMHLGCNYTLVVYKHWRTNPMPHKPYLIYSRILKVIASLFGVVCVLGGIAFGLLWGPESSCLAPGFVVRIVALFVLVLGVLYMIPNKRFSTEKQVRLYMGFTLLFSLALMMIPIAFSIPLWNRGSDMAATIYFLLTCFLPSLAAPASLFLYIKSHQSKVPA